MRKNARLTGEGLTAFLPGYTETSLLFSAERMDWPSASVMLPRKRSIGKAPGSLSRLGVGIGIGIGWE